MTSKQFVGFAVMWWFLSAGAFLALSLILLHQNYGVSWELDTLRLERPWALLLLLSVPWALAVRVRQRRVAAPTLFFARVSQVKQVNRWTLRTHQAPFLEGLRLTALMWLIFGLVGPQSIEARDDQEVEGIDIVLALDVSLSMQAADITPNRFVAMKSVVDDFVSRRPNDRIGAVIFGREAYTLLPITTDKESLRGVIEQLQLENELGHGTAIGNALATSLNRLRRSRAESRVIILLTDGESNSGNISPDQAGQFAQTMGVRIYTVLMGQSDRAPVQQGVDAFGRPVWGQTNMPINPELMERLAQSTNGEAFTASNRQSLEESFHHILDSLERTQIEEVGQISEELFEPIVMLSFVGWLLVVLGTMWLRRNG